MVGLFAQNEKSDPVVGFHCTINVPNIGSHELEDEHDIVSSVEVKLLVFLDSRGNLLFDLSLLEVFLHICLIRLNNILFQTLLFMIKRIFTKNIFNFHLLLVKLLTLLEVDLRNKTVLHLLIFHYQRMIINLFPTYSLQRIIV